MSGMGFPNDPTFYGEDLPLVPRTIPTTPVTVPRDELQAVCERLAHADDINTEAQRICAEKNQEK